MWRQANITAAFWLAVGGTAFAENARELPLFGPIARIRRVNFSTTDAKFSRIDQGRGAVWRVQTGHTADWPGITLPAPNGSWDLSAYGKVVLSVKNIAADFVTVACRVDNPGADGVDHCVNGEVTLAPGQTGKLIVKLKRTSEDNLGGKLFGMRGYPARLGGPHSIDPAAVTQLVVFVAKPATDHAFEISDLRAVGGYTAPTAFTSDAAPFFPFIDTLGQYLHKDWPDKTKSAADLASRRAVESVELSERPEPKEWDKYGGWRAGPQLQATGFFRTQKVDGKWWLADPEGHLFFSHGIDCAGFDEKTPIAGREKWFKNFPGEKPEFGKFLSPARAFLGHYAGQAPECFSFVEANLWRKYGPEWKTIYPRVTQQRLRSWGVNTIGNWSDDRITSLRLTAYTDSIGSHGAHEIEGSDGYWGKFPDVFDPSFAGELGRSMQRTRGKSAGDPWCLGYFSDNEMSWGDDTSIAVAVLKSDPDQAAKKVFIADLQAKYGEMRKLNAAWGTRFASWEALRQNRFAPDPIRARSDLASFYTKAAEQYFRTVRATIKAAAPHQLYLGCRFASVNSLAAAAAARYCDVVSYNIYQRNVDNFIFNGGADVPLLVGEFHFGALDRGLFHAGLVEVRNQAERAKAYQDYVESVLRHPSFVGCHWFQYRDEPVTGRVFDEENYQIGFVDVADTPYPETVAACRAAGFHLYK